MALTATLYHWQINLSDVDRGVYEALDLRLARHPSESLRYLLTRTLAYALSYEDGIRFSKGGLSATEEPPVAVHDPTGRMLCWIDVGAPSAERLHKAAKLAPRVSLYTHSDLLALRREARSRPIHRLEELAVFRIEPGFLDQAEAAFERDGRRNAQMDLLRSEGRLYLTLDGQTLEGAISQGPLLPAE
jgi:uncharacterized protein YaeQ